MQRIRPDRTARDRTPSVSAAKVAAPAFYFATVVPVVGFHPAQVNSG
jgi:hypothetical protein